MKTTNVGLAAMMTLAGFALMASPVSADCDNYGNQVVVGSNYDCTVNQNYCDGQSGPAGSGAGAGAGAGAGGSSGAEAGANAGSSTQCDQCAGSCSPPGGGGCETESAALIGDESLVDGERTYTRQVVTPQGASPCSATGSAQL